MEKKESYWSEQAVPGSFSEKERERTQEGTQERTQEGIQERAQEGNQKRAQERECSSKRDLRESLRVILQSI